MRQAGVMASMGMYALQESVDRLADDHKRAKRLAKELQDIGCWLPRNGQVDTNIVFFALPDDCKVTKEELPPLLYEKYGIKMIPTQIFFAVDGTELFRHEGFMSREDIAAKWQEHDVTIPPRRGSPQ